MDENKKYILLQGGGSSIAYNDNDCFENGLKKKIEDGDKRTPKEIAEDLKKKFYTDFFKKHYKNLVILTAAGTSLDNGSNKGKTRDELWSFCKNIIEAFVGEIEGIETKDFYTSKDIEGLLSYIILYGKIADADKKATIDGLKKRLEKRIKKACNLQLDKSEPAPHKIFLDKITARKSSDPRVQLFTTNYDTLFEQAANEGGFVIVDGFSFTHPREFSGRYFDFDIVHREKTRIKQEESFVSKVFQLYKLHGSLNWERNPDNKIIQRENTDEPLIIYPASEKYESSYEQPYFEMMSRFQQALRKEETLLIVIGFGFQDKHIQNVIVEAVAQNPGFHLVIVNYNGSESIETTHLKQFFDRADKMEVKRKVTILFDTFSEFTKNYPENKTYLKRDNNDTIQP